MEDHQYISENELTLFLTWILFKNNECIFSLLINNFEVWLLLNINLGFIIYRIKHTILNEFNFKFI